MCTLVIKLFGPCRREVPVLRDYRAGRLSVLINGCTKVRWVCSVSMAQFLKIPF